MKERLEKTNWFSCLLFLFVLTIPMQYRYSKHLGSLKKWLLSSASDLPKYFEKKVFFCFSDVLIIGLFLGLIVHSNFKWKQLVIPWSNRWLFIYFAICAASLFFSNGYDYYLHYFRLSQLFISGFIFFIFMQIEIRMGWKQLCRLTTYGAMIGGVFESLLSIMQYFFQKTFHLKWLGEIPYFQMEGKPTGLMSKQGSLCIIDDLFFPSCEKWIARPYGTMLDPNLLSAYLCFSLFFSLLFVMNIQNKWKKRLIHGAIVIQSIALFLTFSRAGIGGYCLGISVVLLALIGMKFKEEKKKVKSVFLLQITTFSLCTMFFFPQIIDRGGIHNFMKTSTHGVDRERKVYEKLAVEQIQQHPLLGVGFNASTIDRKEQHIVKISEEYSHPVHNIFLLIASETGLISLGFFLIFILECLRGYCRKIWTIEQIIFLGIITSFCLIGLYSHFLLSMTSGRIMLFTVLGLMSVAHRYNFNKESIANAEYI